VERWLRLYVPCVFPYLVTGLVTAAGGAWNATIVAEYVSMKSQTYSAFGLGSIISQATNNGQYSLLAAGVVTMAVAVVSINRLLWKRLYRLAEERYSLTA
jgi:NitT/TauT family transport system permease protein